MTVPTAAASRRRVARSGAGAARRVRTAIAGEGGQATVEVVALLPILAAIALLVAGYLAAQRAREAADAAAVAAAMAQLQGFDPKQAAADAAPGWARVTVRIDHGVARTRLRIRGPRQLERLVDVRREVAFAPGGRP